MKLSLGASMRRSRHGPSLLLVSLGISSGLLAGCSTVSSVDLSLTQEPARAGAYLNYAVAKSVFVIQIASATPTAQVPATAAAPSPTSPAPTAKKADATTPVVATTPTQPIDSSACAVLTAEYTAGQTTVSGEISAYAMLLARVSQMAAGEPATQDTPKQLSKDLGKYIKDVRNTGYLRTLSVNKNVIYDRILTDCAPKVTVSIQQFVVPDTTRTFALIPRTNIFYTDTLTFGTDANGFLTNGAPSSASQVTAIASAIASDVGMFVTPSGAVGAVSPAVKHGVVPGPAPLVAVPKLACTPTGDMDIDQQIAALALCVDVAGAHAVLVQISGDLDHPGAMKNLPAALLPITINLPIDQLQANARAPTDGLVTFARDALKVNMTFGCSPRAEEHGQDDSLPENLPTRVGTEDPSKVGRYDGIVVSASEACEFRATQARPGLATALSLASSHFWAQDSRHLTILPTTRGFLVQRSVAYTFAGGQATGVSDSRPSEALAIVSFPGTVLGSFFSGVTTATTNNQAFTNARTASLTAQTNNLTAQTNLLTAQTALKNAKAAQASPSN